MVFMDMILGKSPFPFENESLSGFLLRLARLNGLSTIQKLLITLKVQKPKVHNYGVWSHKAKEKLVISLSTALRRPFYPDDFPCQKNQGLGVDLGQLVDDFEVDFLRVCPQCIQTKTMDWRFQLGYVGHCETHSLLLMDTCPECGTPFEWNTHIYSGCRCGFTWHNYECNEIAPPALATKVYPSIEGDSHYRSEQKIPIGDAIIKMARPFDRILQPMQKMHYSANHSHLVMQAYRYLDNADFRSIWENEFKQSLSDSLNYTSKVFHERIEYVTDARKKAIKNQPISMLRRQVTQKALAQTLKVELKDIADVVKLHQFPKQNNGRTFKIKLFDFEDVLAFFTQFTNKNLDATITVNKKDRRFKQYLATYSQLLADMCDNLIEAELTTEADLSQVIIPESQFISWLQGRLIKACDQPVGFTNARYMLGKLPEDLKQMIKITCLHYAKWRNDRSIDGSSLLEYIKNHKPELLNN